MTTNTFEVQDDGTVEFRTETTLIYTIETSPPQGVAGIGVSTRVTKLDIIAPKLSGAVYSVVSSGVGYTFSGDDADLRDTETEFNTNCSVSIYLNGMFLIKNEDVEWYDANNITLNYQVDNGDEILILS